MSGSEETSHRDEKYLRLALQEARQAAHEKEVPVGAVIVHGERVIARAHNQRERLRDPTAHAEMIAITQAAAALENWRLEGTTLYVTLEPCPMCAGAIAQARIPRVVFGASDPKTGAGESWSEEVHSERLERRANLTGGVLGKECQELLQQFFGQRRADAENSHGSRPAP